MSEKKISKNSSEDFEPSSFALNDEKLVRKVSFLATSINEKVLFPDSEVGPLELITFVPKINLQLQKD